MADEAPAVEKFLSLLECALDAMMIVNSEGRIVVINSHNVELFGYSREELIGRPIEFLVPERYRVRHLAQRSGYSAEPRVRSLGERRQLFGLHRDGREFPAEISLSPVEFDGQHYVVSAIRDVTQQPGGGLSRAAAASGRVQPGRTPYACDHGRPDPGNQLDQ